MVELDLVSSHLTRQGIKVILNRMAQILCFERLTWHFGSTALYTWGTDWREEERPLPCTPDPFPSTWSCAQSLVLCLLERTTVPTPATMLPSRWRRPTKPTLQASNSFTHLALTRKSEKNKSDPLASLTPSGNRCSLQPWGGLYLHLILRLR